MPMRNHHISFILFLLTALLCACDGGGTIELFEGFTYGMPVNEVMRKAEVFPCPDDRRMLCRRSPAALFKTSWEQRFLFSSERLVAVRLITKETPKIRDDVNKWLDSGYRYMPVLIMSGGAKLDVLATLKAQGREGTREAIRQFARRTARDDKTTYLYLDFDKRENLLNDAASYADLAAHAPRDLRGIEQTVEDEILCLTFIAPIARAQDGAIPVAKK